jgi:hypothetical protein
MLANKPESSVTADGPDPVVSLESIEAVLRAVGAPPQATTTSTPHTSPAFSMADDFMTSPFDTPLDEFLSTPLFEDNDMMTSPLIDYLQADDTFSNSPLFGDMSLDFEVTDKSAPALPLVPFPPDLSAFTPPTPLYHTLPSLPHQPTQAIVPTASPANSTPELSPARDIASLPRRRSNATGTRKGVTPQSLLPVDAPIQKRKYVLPSATSRKEVPALFRKRQRAQAFGPDAPEVDEDDLPPLPPDATQKEQIEWKRKQNTLAARKSRKRKLEYQQELENKLAALTEERDTWRTRAQTLQAMLQAQGIEAPAFPE